MFNFWSSSLDCVLGIAWALGDQAQAEQGLPTLLLHSDVSGLPGLGRNSFKVEVNFEVGKQFVFILL